MLISFLLSFFQFKKKICICNGKCPSLCPSYSLANYSFNSSFPSLILNKFKNYRNLEFDFYSDISTFLFDFNADHFSKVNEIKFKTLMNSQPVKINITYSNNSISNQITIESNQEILLSSVLSKFKNIILNQQAQALPSIKPKATSIQKQSKQQKNLLEIENLTPAKAAGNFDNITYIESHKIPSDKFTFISLGDKEDHPLSNAFDGNSSTVWVSSVSNTETVKNYIEITFKGRICIDAIVFEPVVEEEIVESVTTYRYDGYPLVFNVFTLIDEDIEGEMEMKCVFSGTPDSNEEWKRVQFVFSKPIWCDKIKLEFSDVTVDTSFGGEYTVACAGLYFVTPFDCEILYKENESDKYNNEYIKAHKYPYDSITAYSSGDLDGYPLSNTFDDLNSYWVSSIVTTETESSYIFFNFRNEVYLKAIVYKIASSTKMTSGTRERHYHGSPLFLKVFTSSNDEPLNLKCIFSRKHNKSEIFDFYQFEFSEPFWCDKIKFEFAQVSLDNFFTFNYSAISRSIFFISPLPSPTPMPARTPSLSRTPTPSRSPTQSPHPTPLATPSSTPNPADDRIVHIVTNNAISSIQVFNSQFNNIYFNDHGGAIYLLNSGIICNTNIFIKCRSTKSGGAVYASNSYDFINNLTFVNLIFENCQSNCGGAMYVHTISPNFFTYVNKCIFSGNGEFKDAGDELSDNNLKGGSSIFLTSRNAKIENCLFKGIEGEESAVKIYNTDKIFQNNYKDKLCFFNLIFELPKGSKGAILYINENKNSKLDVQDCIFKGDLAPGSNYINVYYNDNLLNN